MTEHSRSHAKALTLPGKSRGIYCRRAEMLALSGMPYAVLGCVTQLRGD